VAGVFNLQGLVLFGLYVAGIVSAMAVPPWGQADGWQGTMQHPLMIELPSYRWPHARNLLLGLSNAPGSSSCASATSSSR
jgi:ferrous iron transport protein B